ncbi:CHAD domain-containing protein [Pontibacter sp. JAM-7]|uniref:CHAD domain-containing protein n=1 Tax=Pontibacter sp. JAM-7 TaxID=3366581 RepID=UPI003AF62E91
MSDPVFEKISPLIQRQVHHLQHHHVLSDEAVHELRVLCKRLRAALRLYQPICRKGDLRRVDLPLRQTARAFAARRDNHVQLKTLKRLLKHYPDLKPLTEGFKQQLQSDRQALVEPDTTRAAQWLNEALVLWQNLMQQSDADFVAPGLAYSYEKATRLGDRALQGDRDKPYHRWRKWSKFWLYQQELLVRPKGSNSQIYREKLTELGSDLGRFHDLYLLQASILKHVDCFSSQADVTLLLQRLAASKRSYRRTFAAEYRPLFGLAFGELPLVLPDAWHPQPTGS